MPRSTSFLAALYRLIAGSPSLYMVPIWFVQKLVRTPPVITCMT